MGLNSKTIARKVWGKLFPLKKNDRVKIYPHNRFSWRKPRYGYILHIFEIGSIPIPENQERRAYTVIVQNLDGKNYMTAVFFEDEIEIVKKT